MRQLLCVLAILLWSSAQVLAQDLDSVPSVQKRTTVTLADQITNSGERSAFLDLFQHASPAEMRARAEAFVTRFSQSAFLAQAYEVAARSSFDLEEFDAGLRYARKSLTLLPENPLLLVSVADVEAKRHLNSGAIGDADEALRDLESFAGPASVSDGDWPSVKEGLQATANFAKGRAQLQQGLAESDAGKRKEWLRQSEASLVAARRLNARDPEIVYTLGLAQLSSGNASDAAVNFAAAYGSGGELASKANETLKAIYKLQYPTASISYEAFIQRSEEVAKTEAKRLVGLTQERKQSGNASPAYFGSESCRSCHADIYREWSQTGMSKMFRPYAPQNIVGDFSVNNQFFLGDTVKYRHGKLEVTAGDARNLFARMVIRNGRHYFDILQSDQKWHSYPIDYTIGSKFEQAYATRLPNGEIHVFPIQYNVGQKRWVNFWKVIDGPGSERADPRNWERLDASTSYQAICAVCHTSQLKNAKGRGFETINLEFKEPGIDCEMCHGPSGEHVVAAIDGEYVAKPPLDPPVNFARVTNQQFVAICAQCHMQSAIRVPGPHGELNYSSSGSFFGTRTQTPFGEFSRKGFYADGRFRQTTFIVESLERSQCFKKGGVSCGTCHDPHGHDSASNPASLKFRNDPDLMCTGCHMKFKSAATVSLHTRHRQESDASRCVSCHMPRIMHALLFEARYHQIDDIPNAQLTKQFGQDESPNACLLCHTKENADWVQQQLSTWRTTASQAKLAISSKP